MGKIRTKLRVTRGGAILWVSLFLVALLGWGSLALFAVRTPEGVHCPTAAVQSVLTEVKDCCGRIVGYEARKPQEGEKQFLQCRCAEKRTAQQQSIAESGNPQVEIVPPQPFVLLVPEPLPEPIAEHRYFARLTTVPSPPSPRPPACA